MAVDNQNRDSIDLEDYPLSQVVDKPLLKELLKSITNLFNLPIKIYDTKGDVVVEQENPLLICNLMKSKRLLHCLNCDNLLATTVGNVKGDIKEREYYHCGAHLSFVTLPLNYELNRVAILVIGPFLLSDNKDSFINFLNSYALPESKQILMELPPLKQPVLEKLVGSIKSIIEHSLFFQYKYYIASELHLKAISEAYNDLEKRNRELKEALEKAKEADRVKSNFLASISHELRTPLTSIIGYSEMLVEGLAGELQPEQKQFAKTIKEKGEKLLTMVSAILDYTRLYMGRMSFHFEDVPVIELCMDAVEMIEKEADRRGVTIDVDIEDGLPSIKGDREKLARALFHVLDNAVKFSPVGGVVRIEASLLRVPYKADEDLPLALVPEEQPIIEIRIKDQGIGIPNEFKERIFDPFYQIDSSTTREHGGIGLGLTVVKQFIEAHNGEIEIESKEGEGTVCKIRLKAIDE